MSVTLVRHTKPKVDDGICYGATDLELAQSFEEEASQVIAALDASDKLITSPLQRCRKLADKIGETFNLRPEVDQRIREMDFGAWEGQAWSKIPKQELDRWANDFLHARPHGGDSVAMLRQRTLEALAEYQEQEHRIIVVTHSGVIKAALSDGDTAKHFSTAVEFGGIIKLSGHSQ